MRSAIDPLRAAAVAALALGTLAVWAPRPTGAQTVPAIDDVYATPESEKRDLGPTRDPDVIVGRFVTRADALDAVRYDVEVVDALSPNGLRVVGNVLIDLRADDREVRRYRASLRGRGEDGEELAAVYAFDGERRFFLDLLGKRSTTDAAEPTWLRTAALLPVAGSNAPVGAGEPVYLGPSDIDGEPCYRLHVAIEDRGEHLYRHFSQNDAWPRRIEHVGASPDGTAILEATFSNVVRNPPVNDGQFRPFVPEGFAETPSERSEKRQDGFPILAGEGGERVARGPGLSAVPQDGLDDPAGSPVVQQELVAVDRPDQSQAP
jgi:hypothetical protein